MAEHPGSYTDTDVELAVRAAARAQFLSLWPDSSERADQHADELAADEAYRAEITAVLSALASAGRLLPVGHRYVNGDIVPEGSTE